MRTRRRRYSRRTRSDVHVLSLAPTPRAPARAGDPPHLDEPTTRTRYRRLVVLRSSSRRRSCSWPAGLRSSFAPRADATNPASSPNQVAVVVCESKGLDVTGGREAHSQFCLIAFSGDGQKSGRCRCGVEAKYCRVVEARLPNHTATLIRHSNRVSEYRLP